MSTDFYPIRLVERPEGAVFDLTEDGQDHSVNFSSASALRILDVLGIPVDPMEGLTGTCDAENFLGRVLLALAIEPDDTGMPAHRIAEDDFPESLRGLMRAFGGATHLMAARPPGQLQRQLAQLAELGRYCLDHGYLVAWA